MKQMYDEEGYELLRSAGFTALEINRLSQMRRDYRESIPLDYARLQFVRWLVTTGRLTDQIAEEDASCVPQCQGCTASQLDQESLNSPGLQYPKDGHARNRHSLFSFLGG
jgi:hypothetical protein